MSKRKADQASSAGQLGTKQTNEEAGETYWQLSSTRRITVQTYQNRAMVSIREYYTDKASGELRPGKKGISLPLEQWNMLKKVFNEVDDTVTQLSEKTSKEDKRAGQTAEGGKKEKKVKTGEYKSAETVSDSDDESSLV
ncbi:hypothetical protein PYCC9005_000624 [Savitreella phatthalungensis]